MSEVATQPLLVKLARLGQCGQSGQAWHIRLARSD